MSATDEQLLRRISEGGDAEAFSLVVSRYADLVYSVCARILRDEARAADAAQETFFELFKHAACVRGCLGGWLHRVATRRSIDQIRSDEARRRRESAYAEVRNDVASTWSEVEAAVDAAMDTLDDESRELLTLHYLRQQTMGQIGALKGISQPTVSRRVNQALSCLRNVLKERGVAVGVVPLQTILVHGTQLAPQSLLLKLGKMALAQAASTQTAGFLGVLGTGSKVTVASGAAAALVLAGFLLTNDSALQSSAPLPLPARTTSPPVVSAAVSSAPVPPSARVSTSEQPQIAASQGITGASAPGPAVPSSFYRSSATALSGNRPASGAPAPRSPAEQPQVHSRPVLPVGYGPPEIWQRPLVRHKPPLPAPAPQFQSRGYLTVVPSRVPPGVYTGGGGGSVGGGSVQLPLRQHPNGQQPKRTRVR